MYLAVLLAGSLLVAVVVFRYAFPHEFVRTLLNVVRRLLGFRVRSIDVDGIAWPYLESGPRDGEVVLLLHGFGGDKDNWPMYARSLRRNYRIIVPDLPGFGDNTRDPQTDYRVSAQVKRLQGFVAALGIDRFHIAGNSMGGWLALTFTLAHPDRILTLALVNNAGVRGEHKSELEHAVERGESLLTVSSAAEFDWLLSFITYKPVPLPGVVKRFIGDEAIARQPFLDTVFWSLTEEWRDAPLNERLHELAVPVLILWGRHDRVIDVSCVDAMQAAIPDNRCVVLEDAGHIPMLERPREAAAAHLQLLSENRRPLASS